MFQGQEESHEENQILKRQIGKVIIFKSSSFFFFLIVIHLLDVMIDVLVHLPGFNKTKFYT